MKLRYKFIFAFLSLTIPIIIVGLVSLHQLNSIAQPIRRDIPQQAEQLASSSSLEEKALYIRYYDEVLTQSARNYAFTGDAKWKMRYEEESPKLDVVIKEALAMGDSEDTKIFVTIESSNAELIGFEEQVMKLVDEGDRTKAIEILDSAEYAKEKQTYQNGLVTYAERRGTAFDKSVLESTQKLGKISKETDALITTSIVQISVILLVSIILTIIFAVIFGNSLIQPLSVFKQKAQAIADGNFSDRMPVTSKDELGQLAEAVNTMSEELKESKESVDKKVTERTNELQKLNALMTGRELKMVELKKEIEMLKKEHI